MIMLKVEAVPFQWQRHSLGEAWTGSRGLARAQAPALFQWWSVTERLRVSTHSSFFWAVRFSVFYGYNLHT